MALFDEFFQPASHNIDLSSLRRAWQALGGAYDVESWQLPLPLWAQRPLEHQGQEAWNILSERTRSLSTLAHDLDQDRSSKAMCIYLHLPFCTSKCGFCDSYSFKLGSQQTKHIDRYLDLLCSELRLWSQAGNLAQRPVSTVHLGGGTPAIVGEAGLARLAACLRQYFNITAQTEWALETTVDSLAPPMLECLHALGFRRLHIGVQSMEDAVRTAIGRRRTAGEVCRAVEAALERGWVVSVDLLCGLPGQTLPGFMNGIETLVGLGVNGFSLYELLIRRQNLRWAKQYGLTQQSHLPNYFLLAAGANRLETLGYQKNLFNHWADERDGNIYFTFPTRGEDLLAVGAIADGVFGDYHYRHPVYAGYIASSSPGLAGGLRRTPLESLFCPIETAILSGHIPAAIANRLSDLRSGGVSLIDHWLEHQMVKPGPDGSLELTTNGTWFAGNLVNEARPLFAA